MTLAANLGIVAGLVFLVIEVRQNEDALRESNLLSVLDARTVELQQYNDFRAMLLEVPGLLDIWNSGLRGDSLSQLDDSRFLYTCQNYLWLSVTVFERSTELGRDSTAAGTVRQRGDLLRESAGFRRCWEDNRDTILAYGLSKYVESVEAVASN